MGIGEGRKIRNDGFCSLFVVVIGIGRGEDNYSRGNVCIDTHTTNGSDLSFFEGRKEGAGGKGFGGRGSWMGVKKVNGGKRGSKENPILGGEFNGGRGGEGRRGGRGRERERNGESHKVFLSQINIKTQFLSSPFLSPPHTHLSGNKIRQTKLHFLQSSHILRKKERIFKRNLHPQPLSLLSLSLEPSFYVFFYSSFHPDQLGGVGGGFHRNLDSLFIFFSFFFFFFFF